MKKGFKILLLVLLLAGLAYFALQPKEPSYQGRPISAWLDDMAAWKQVDYYAAIQKTGTNCLPYAVASLSRNDSKWQIKYRALWPKFPIFLKTIFPQPKQNLQVVNGANVFFYIGPDSLPQAITLLKHHSSTVRQAAAWGIGAIRRKSYAANMAIPVLIETLSDPEREVRFHAVIAFMEMGADASNAVPALTKVVGDTGVGAQTNNFFYLRAAAARALGNIGPKAKSALPALKTALQPSDSNLRACAAIAIWRIDSDAETALTVLLQEMPRAESELKWDWIIALGEMGARAKEAIPQLSIELKENKRYLELVTNALVKIDPDAAAKLGVYPSPERK